MRTASSRRGGGQTRWCIVGATGGDNAVDALVVAAAEQSHDEVVAADVTDLVELAAHAGGVTIRHLGA
ncbi:MAG: hypothetical protein M3535_01100 [Actinomycetota bacterium]|nr:hypothetical protein [Actinomycetota bacterium]